MTRSSEFVNTLEGVIQKRGAMDKLTSNSATVEISARVKDICEHFASMIGRANPNFNIRILLNEDGNTSNTT